MRPNPHTHAAILVPLALLLVLSTAPQAQDRSPQDEDLTFGSWIASFNYTAFPNADLRPTGDADRDGIANAVEFVIGNLPNQAKVENLPSLTRVTDPDIDAPPGDYMKFSYRRSEASVNADAVADVVYRLADLTGPWTLADAGADGVVQVEVENPAIPGDDVDVYIPLASSTHFFARLQVTVP